ncbi:nitroreductase family protein [Paenibacillus rigui]|uniref:Nitroreductase family protein n=1 Tax=Paenibacillus rigui TaxID=554312 RepID=A0A229ULS1_9BACL|nr:nitroreductase family protein [Paenibacillus rigui]OXM84322.1 nitroreductase family protein [Paenibacillus rigui]
MTQATQQALYSSVVRDRHSVRKYDPSVTISKEELTEILAEATLAPSGANIQPWRFLIINDPALKATLLPIARNQEQVVQASAIIAVLADTQADSKIDQIYGAAVQAGYMTEQAKEQLIQNMKWYYANMPEEVKRSLLVDSGLVSMQIMLSAKARGYDTVAMGGYDKPAFKEAFGISERYQSVMLIAIGKAAQEAHPTVRLPIEDITFWNAISE